MPRSATVLNLAPVSDTDPAAIAKLLDVDSVVLVAGKEIRDRGARGGLAWLLEAHRKSGADVFAIHSLDWTRQSQRTSLYLIACIVPATRRLAIDVTGRNEVLSFGGLISKEIPYSMQQKSRGRHLVNRTRSMVSTALVDPIVHHPIDTTAVNNILYMRTDLWFGVKAGGSIGHVAGVIDGFVQLGKNVQVMSWEKPPLINESARFIQVSPKPFFINDRELALLDYNNALVSDGVKSIDGKIDAIYARYSLDCWAPAFIANAHGLPLIIEFNGSEVWIEKHWGRGLKHPDVAQAIEDWILKAADLITVVSSPLKDQLVEKGIDKDRILVNPNAVDPSRFDPANYSPAETSALKKELGIPDDAKVAGFIGTFSPWHGVNVLADAIPIALAKCPNLHFLLIGTGPLYDSVKEKLGKAGVLKKITLTGLVPQDQAPKYLMCADFFLSPHVPNQDGTPFFGSPTKLFEYMALGKGILASDLDQLGEILEHGSTALLVPPGDIRALSDAIVQLYNDPDLSDRLGMAARIEALEKHTWKAHVSRILQSIGMIRDIK